jgi:hypothetical protein
MTNTETAAVIGVDLESTICCETLIAPCDNEASWLLRYTCSGCGPRKAFECDFHMQMIEERTKTCLRALCAFCGTKFSWNTHRWVRI